MKPAPTNANSGPTLAKTMATLMTAQAGEVKMTISGRVLLIEDENSLRQTLTRQYGLGVINTYATACLLYTSDAADE